jgi:hypothetical protein
MSHVGFETALRLDAEDRLQCCERRPSAYHDEIDASVAQGTQRGG